MMPFKCRVGETRRALYSVRRLLPTIAGFMLCLAPPAAASAQGLPELLYFGSLGREVGNAFEQWGEMSSNAAAASRDIAEARAAFWATYPDGEGHAVAAERFFRLLRDKDILYTVLELNTSARPGRNGIPQGLMELVFQGGTVDGGIPGVARPAFDHFYEQLVASLDEHSGGDAFQLFSPRVLQAAWEDSKDDYDSYVMMRNIAEFLRAGREPPPQGPRAYAYWLMAPLTTGINVREELVARYDTLVARFGRNRVEEVFLAVQDLPKERIEGDLCRVELCVREPENLGVVVARDSDDRLPEGARWASSASPAQVASALLVPEDPLSYALWVFTNGDRLSWWRNSWSPRASMFVRGQVEQSLEMVIEGSERFRSAVQTYGEERVADAARRLRDAPRNLRGELIDLEALGVRVREPGSSEMLAEGVTLISQGAPRFVFEGMLEGGADGATRDMTFVETGLPDWIDGIGALRESVRGGVVDDVVSRVMAAPRTSSGAVPGAALGLDLDYAPGYAVTLLLVEEAPLALVGAQVRYLRDIVAHCRTETGGRCNGFLDPYELTNGNQIVEAAGALGEEQIQGMFRELHDQGRLDDTGFLTRTPGFMSWAHDLVQVDERPAGERIRRGMRALWARYEVDWVSNPRPPWMAKRERWDHLWSSGGFTSGNNPFSQVSAILVTSREWQQSTALGDYYNYRSLSRHMGRFFDRGMREAIGPDRLEQLQPESATFIANMLDHLEPACNDASADLSSVVCLQLETIRYFVLEFPELVPEELVEKVRSM